MAQSPHRRRGGLSFERSSHHACCFFWIGTFGAQVAPAKAQPWCYYQPYDPSCYWWWRQHYHHDYDHWDHDHYHDHHGHNHDHDHDHDHDHHDHHHGHDHSERDNGPKHI